MEYSSLDDVPHSVRMTLQQQQHQQRQILSPAFSIVTDSSPQQTHTIYRCIYVHTYIYIHTQTYMCIYIYVCVCACQTYIYTYVYQRNVCLHVYVRVHVCIYTCECSRYRYRYIYVCVCVCACRCVCVCAVVHLRTWYVGSNSCTGARKLLRDHIIQVAVFDFVTVDRQHLSSKVTMCPFPSKTREQAS